MNSPFLPVSLEGEPRAETVFFEALQQPPGAREAFLDEECGADPAFRAEVEAMLQDHENAGSFLSGDAVVSAGLNTEITSRMPEEAGGKIGPYKLLQQIGEGGCGVVWMAEQEEPVRRLVALKVIKLGMDTKQVIARFEAERQALALMDHPNIARVLDAGATDAGRPYFVMELVRGIRITNYCDQNNLPTEKRLALFAQVCQAVQHAHQKGIIHRDLKPSNILVTLHDGVPVPKVIDFGIAKATTGQQLTDKTIFTAFEQFIGTPAYMSPEQAEMSGLDIDTRSDIYALGVLLYELLTGRTPFDAKELLSLGLEAMRRTIREQEPPRPSTRLSTLLAADQTAVARNHQTEPVKLAHSLRGDLDWIVMKALEKDRTRRYETATELAKDIQRYLLSEPVQARPPTPVYRFRRFARRNRIVFAAGTGIAAALIAGTIVSLWQAFQAQHEARRANVALSELRASAPAFAAMSRTLVAEEKFDEAIGKLDIAIKLRPDEPDYLLTKADVLQSQLRFSEAAPLYREVMRLNSGEKRAEPNARLSEKLASEAAAQPKLSRQSLIELFNAMTKEQRPAAELMRAGKLLGEENKLLLSYWLERLIGLPIPPDRPLEQRLTADEAGRLTLDLSGTDVADLSPLKGMPLDSLLLLRCQLIRDLKPLRGMPLRSLVLRGTELVDLTPLSGIKTLTTLDLSGTKIRDLFPIQGLPLHTLNLEGTLVSDLTPLAGMTLETLNLRKTPVADLSPLRGVPLKSLNLDGTRVGELTVLAGMPLNELDCSNIPASNFSPLAEVPLVALSLEGTAVGNLSILRGMPLKMLGLDRCLDATGFEILSDIPTLEVLTLPYFTRLSAEDFRSIGALRSHPALRQIEEDPLKESLRSGGLPLAAEPKEKFWTKYDGRAQVFEAAALAESLARQGRYLEAAKLLREKAISGASWEYWIGLGATVFASGDRAGYESICREMMQIFRRGRGDAETVRVSSLSSESGVPIAELRILMPHMALINEHTPYRSHFLVTNGLLEYRDGRYAESIELLRAINSERFPWTGAAADVILAMAFYQRGELQTAKTALDRAREAIAAFWPSGHAGPAQGFDWLYSYLLLQEADKLIGSAVENADSED